MKTLNIQKKEKINFDETRIQIECMKGQEILIPFDIKEFYAINSENKKSITVFEMINVAEHYSPPSLIIIQNQKTYDIMILRKTPSGHSYFDLRQRFY